MGSTEPGVIVVRESRIEREGEGERGERPLDRSSRSSPSKGRSEEGTGRDDWWWAGWSIGRTYLGEIYIGGRLRSLSKSRNDRRGLGRMRDSEHACFITRDREKVGRVGGSTKGAKVCVSMVEASRGNRKVVTGGSRSVVLFFYARLHAFGLASVLFA